MPYSIYAEKQWRNIKPLQLLFFAYRKDVRLPVQLQRAMAAEAEAAREARAKVLFRLVTYDLM